jgi:hypothetical protein
MKVSTPPQTVVVEYTAKPAEVFRTLLAPILTVVRQKARRETRREKHVKTPHTGHKEPRRPGSCLILVESDIKQDLHGIVP